MDKDRFFPPRKIHEMRWAHTHTSILKTAVELDVFNHIAQGRTSVQGVARASRSSTRGMEMLLNALVGFELLRKNRVRYRLTLESRVFLVKGSPLYLGKNFLLRGASMELWSDLTRAVKRGKPVRTKSISALRKRFLPELAKAIFPGSYIKARALAQSWNYPRGREEYRILDVAAGSSAWSLPFAERFKGVRVTALDFPEVLLITSKYARELGVGHQYSYLPGDLEVVDFGRDGYDLIILGNICHSIGVRKSQRLFRKCKRALKRKGHLLIADSLPNDRRDGPLFPLVFALNMLLHSEEGNVFTFREYKSWLTKAGLQGVKTLKVPQAPSPLILARR